MTAPSIFPDTSTYLAANLGYEDALKDFHNNPPPRPKQHEDPPPPPPPRDPNYVPLPRPEDAPPRTPVPSVKKTREQLLDAIGYVPRELREGQGLDFLHGFYLAGYWLFQTGYVLVQYDMLELLNRAVRLGGWDAKGSLEEKTMEQVWEEMRPWTGPALYQPGGMEYVHSAYRMGRWWQNLK